MKKRNLLLVVAGMFTSVFGVIAQRGVDNGTAFGTGEDSIRCITNISLFAPYAKNGNYRDALEFWKLAYTECPAATKDIYLYGVRIVAWQIANETDPVRKAALVEDLMDVYDKRIKYFGNDPRYGEDWIIARKAQDYVQQAGDKADYRKVYAWTKEALDKFGEKTDALAVSYYMFASNQLMVADPSHKETYIQDYLKSSAILEAQIKAARIAEDEKELSTLEATKSGLDNGFAASGAADCETLQSLYAAKVEQNKSNLSWLKETITLLRKMHCNEIDAYFAAAVYAHGLEPTAESAMGLAKKAVKDKQYTKAIAFFEEAAGMESDKAVKAEDYYLIAMLSFEQDNYSKARQYCLKAVEINPDYGAPYLLIGKMYAATAKSVYPNDLVLQKTVYYAAVDKFERARQIDHSVAEEAAKLISTYRSHFPSTEDIFMHPDLEKGQVITIGGWIGERTTVREK